MCCSLFENQDQDFGNFIQFFYMFASASEQSPGDFLDRLNGLICLKNVARNEQKNKTPTTFFMPGKYRFEVLLYAAWF